MRKDYLPAADSELRVWLDNFAATASNNQTLLGLTNAEITALDDAHSTLKDALQEVVAQKAVLESAVLAKDAVVEGATQDIRGIVRRIQTLPGVPDGMKAQLGITVARSSHSRPALFTPAGLSVTPNANGFNLLRWKGNGNRPGTAYLIEAKQGLTGDWQIADVVTATRYKHLIETVGQAMLYRVSARRRGENSMATAAVSVFAA